jgi:hypothetical protein
LFQVLERFKNVDLHPEVVDNPTMGRSSRSCRFNEALNENPESTSLREMWFTS